MDRIDEMVEKALRDIEREADDARELISAMHSFAVRSLAQSRRWHIYHQINGDNNAQKSK